MAYVQATIPPQSWPTMIAFFALKWSDRVDVGHELLQAIILDPFRLIAQVVSPLIDGHDVKVLGQFGNLLAPRVPEVRKPVDHHHQGAAPFFDVMNLYAVRVDVTVLTQVGRSGWTGRDRRRGHRGGRKNC